MGRFLVRRLLQSALLMWAILTLTFVLVRLAPGGPESLLIDNPNLPPEAMQQLRCELGLCEPLPVQYARWLGNAVRLDFGRSHFNAKRPVVDVIAERIGPTAQLGLLAYLVALAGIPLGILAAFQRGRLTDNVIRIFTVVGQAVPTWWLGLTIIVLMSATIGWFPNGQGRGSPLEWLKYIIIPALLLGLGGIIVFTRYVRSEVLEVIGQDHVRTARAKGLATGTVTRWHVLRNALLPVVTLLGGLLPGVLAGSVLIEFIFNWPGMGRLFLDAASQRDYPLLLGMLSLSTLLSIVGTLIADLAYGLVDPRIRYS